MPAKGSKYATIDVDVGACMRDEMSRTREIPAQLARRLGVNRARVHEGLNDEWNTIMAVEVIVNKTMKGDYMLMAKYAKTKEGLKTLRRLNFEKRMSLSPYQDELFEKMYEKLGKLILTDPDKAEELLNKL